MVFFLIVVPCVSGSKDLQFLFFFKFNVPSCQQFAIFVEQLNSFFLGIALVKVKMHKRTAAPLLLHSGIMTLNAVLKQ